MEDISLLHHFILHKNAESGLAVKSIAAYHQDIADFLVYLDFLNKPLLHVLEADIHDYIASLHDKGYKAASLARKISTLRQFFLFLYLENHLSHNPCKHLESPVFRRTLPDPLTIDEVKLLLQAAQQGVFPHNLRLIALLELVYGAGLRVSELVSLPVAAVLDKQDYTLILGKGKKERLIPLTSYAKQAIADYLPYRLFFCQNRPSLFLFPSTGKEGHLTRVRFFQILKALAPITGIPSEKLKPHNFRHGFATDLLRNGADLKSIQSLLGHESITTTEIYTHLKYQDIEDNLLKYHPLQKSETV